MLNQDGVVPTLVQGTVSFVYDCDRGKNAAAVQADAGFKGYGLFLYNTDGHEKTPSHCMRRGWYFRSAPLIFAFRQELAPDAAWPVAVVSQGLSLHHSR
jgi:hypothetical protein